MSKSYRLTPPLWRKAVQRYCHFWNWQIFLQLFFAKLLTILTNIAPIRLIIGNLNQIKKIQKKFQD